MGIYGAMAHDDVRSGLSRRGFLTGAAALGAGLVTAGCAGTYDVGSGITGSSGGDNQSTLVYWNLLTGGDGTHMVAIPVRRIQHDVDPLRVGASREGEFVERPPQVSPTRKTVLARERQLYIAQSGFRRVTSCSDSEAVPRLRIS